jgi:hypothetical protein
VSERKIAAIPTHVKPSVDKDGRKRPAHISARHRNVEASDDAAIDGPLGVFIARHGGAKHFCATLDEMTPEQRAKLLDAMAHVDGSSPADVMKKLGIHEPQASEDDAAIAAAREQFLTRLSMAKDEGVIGSDEYDAVSGICQRDGLEAAIAALQALRAPIISETAPPPEAAATEAPAATAAAAEGAAGVRASLQAQADELYQKHVVEANRAVRADFEVEKRKIRGWKIPAQMTEAPEKYRAQAAAYLDEWRRFCEEHGLTDALS